MVKRMIEFKEIEKGKIEAEEDQTEHKISLVANNVGSAMIELNFKLNKETNTFCFNIAEVHF